MNRRRFRLTYTLERRVFAVDVGGWRIALILSLFWLRPSHLFLWWDGSAGNCPILRVGPVVVTYWRSDALPR